MAFGVALKWQALAMVRVLAFALALGRGLGAVVVVVGRRGRYDRVVEGEEYFAVVVLA
jgi:hypothetical protein